MIPVIQGIQNSQTHRSREKNGGCHGLEREENGGFSFNKYNTSVMQDEYILEIRCTTYCLLMIL